MNKIMVTKIFAPFLGVFFMMINTSCREEVEEKDHYRRPSDSSYSDMVDYSKCGYRIRRDCTEKEKDYINDIVFLIKKIKSVAEKDFTLSEHFYSYETTPASQKSVYLLGENHTDLINMIDNYGFIEKNLSKGDIVLLEGAQRGSVSSVRSRFSNLYCTLEYERKGYDYDPDKQLDLCKSFSDLSFDTLNAIPYDLLKLSQAKYRFWDDMDAWDITDGTMSMRERNKSMVNEILDSLGDHKVFVIAGALHSPVGEYADLRYKYRFSVFNPVAQDVASIYEDFPDEVSTQEIFESLANLDAVYLSHKKLHKYRSEYMPRSLF